MWKKISGVLGALILIGSVVTGYIWLDTNYAKAYDMKVNRIDIQINQLRNDIRWYQDQMTYLMTRCNVKNPNQLPQYAYHNYVQYQNSLNQLKIQLDALMKARYGK